MNEEEVNHEENGNVPYILSEIDIEISRLLKGFAADEKTEDKDSH